MIAWLTSLALAGTPPDVVRDGKPIREGRVALAAVQVEGFAGGLFHHPDGEAIETPPFPASIDLDAVAGRVREALHATARARGVRISDTPAAVSGAARGPVGVPEGFVAVPWDGWVPGDLQALLAPDRDADGLLVVKISLGWCPGAGEGLPLEPSRSVPCVRARDTSLGEGPPGALGYLFRKRLDGLSRTIIAKRPTVLAKRYDYTALADDLYADRPILGEGATLQAQAEDAAARAATALMGAAIRPRRGGGERAATRR